MLSDFETFRRNGARDHTEAIRAMIAELLGHLQPRWMLTFNFNANISSGGAHKKMRQCLMRIESAKLGRNWSNKPTRLRLQAVALMEHADTNVHWHCAVWTLFDEWEDALKAGQRHWETLVPSGSLHISPVGDIEGLAAYMTKEQYTGAHLDAMFVYGPERSPSPAPRRR